MVDRVGQQLGNYQLVSLLGQGGSASVYLGKHVRLNQQAAIKVLHAHLTQAEAEHFQQEAQTIATLVHPGIVRVFDYDVQDGVSFLVIDYAPHGTLRRRYPKGSQMPLPVIISSVKQVADALQYAHEQKFIHRDVKPENMLLGRRQEVLLSDFGIATIAHSTSSLDVGAEGASGTLAYMAPEQIEGHPRPASDQYALGVVIYEWLCGSCPFEGSFSEVLVQHLSLPPPPLHERIPTIPGEVEQIVLKALAKDPKQRFASVQDFALALEVASTGDSPGSTRLILASGNAAEVRLTTKHHLPSYLTPLLGREQEVVEACTLLRRPEVRLVTLTGTGGIGKTRLAVQLATELVADFVDGVSFVSLAPISDPELVIPTIAQTLDVKESGMRPLMDLLKAFLQDKYVLLVLDNFEHLLPAAPQLADLLTSCPHLNILVTSRAVLHVQGEHEFLVSPLALPDLTHLPEQELLSKSPAVALFLQRAQAVKPAFQLTKSTVRPIAEICTRLDGLPLAIELAAARIKLLPPQALLTRMSQRLHLLTGGAQNLPARQQSLRNTIEWSYQLLDADEQQLFQRLAVFVGGCTLEAIEAVCAALDSDVAALPVLDGVASLIDKSLLQLTEQESQEPRLMMLETIREYALETLVTFGELENTRQAHSAYYLRLAEEAEPELEGPMRKMWWERLGGEHENLRAASQWILDQVRREKTKQSTEMALRFGCSMCLFWVEGGYWNEGRTFLEQALTESRGVLSSLRTNALTAAGHLAFLQGDYDQTEALCEEILPVSQEQGATADSLQLLGYVAWYRGDLVKAYSHLEQALTLQRELGDKRLIAISLYYLANVERIQGEYAQGCARLEEGLAINRERGNIAGIAIFLYQLAKVLFFSQGDQERIHSLLEESLALSRELGDERTMTNSLLVLGRLALSQGDTITARALAEQCVMLSRKNEMEWGMRESLPFLASVFASQGDLAKAHALYQESLEIKRGAFDKELIVTALEGLASVAAAEGKLAWSAQLWGVAEALRESLGAPTPPAMRATNERSLAAVRTQLEEKAFIAAWKEGRSMTVEQVLAAQGRTLAPKATPISRVATSTPSAKSATTYPAGLTAREVEVLQLVAQGLTDAQVAEQLFISPLTFNTHLTSIYGKIGGSSRSAATRYAIEHQFI